MTSSGADTRVIEEASMVEHCAGEAGAEISRADNLDMVGESHIVQDPIVQDCYEAHYEPFRDVQRKLVTPSEAQIEALAELDLCTGLPRDSDECAQRQLTVELEVVDANTSQLGQRLVASLALHLQDALETLTGIDEVSVATGLQPHCASPPRPAPVGLEGLTRLAVQPVGIESCIDWFVVNLWLDDDNIVHAVQLDLYEP